MRRIEEQDGNSNDGAGNPRSRFHALATKITLGGVVLDSEAVDFETIVRFRYRVVRKGFIWCVEKSDRREKSNVLVGWWFTRKGAQYACWLANHASDLALEDGWL